MRSDPLRLCLVRHGITAMQVERRYCGHSNPPLAPAGVEQMCALRPTLRPLLAAGARVVSSDLERARASAELLAEGAPVPIMPELREIHFGAWEGLRFDETGCEDAETLRSLDFQFPGGESARVMCDRVWAAIAEIISPPAPVTVVVAHAGSLAALRLAMSPAPKADFWDLMLPPAGIAWLTLTRDGWMV